MWPFHSTCQTKARLIGKTVVITGANTGIGKETARDLYRRGARVILACRDLNKANAAIEELKSVPPSKPEREQFQGNPGELAVCKLNLCSFTSVRECARTLINTEPNIHILINNAGVMMCPYEKTEDGNEMQLQSNHLGHFLLTLLLLPKLKMSAPGSRIINVSSMAHSGGTINFEDLNSEKSYAPIKAYQQSKLANVLFTKELARKLKESNIDGITTYSLHPGVIATELGRHLDNTLFRGARFLFGFFKFAIKNPEQGAQTTIYCATDETISQETGGYYKECKISQASTEAKNVETAAKLWDESLKLVDKNSQDDLMKFFKTS